MADNRMSFTTAATPSWESMHRRMKGAAHAASHPPAPAPPTSLQVPGEDGVASESTPGDVRFACPFCAQHIACDQGCCGQLLTCHKCSAEICVPPVESGASSRRPDSAFDPGDRTRLNTCAPVGIRLPSVSTRTGTVLSYVPPSTAAPRGEIKFACPQCTQHIACDATSSGRALACPGCGTQLCVPPAQGDAPVAHPSPPPPPPLFTTPRRVGVDNSEAQARHCLAALWALVTAVLD